MRVLVTRPMEDATRFVAALTAAGNEAVISPALEIVPIADAVVGPEPSDTILITSANAVRALAARTADRRHRVLTVGPASATAAQELGFVDVQASPGHGVAGLMDWVRSHERPAEVTFYYPSAEDTTGDLEAALAASGFQMRREILYRAEFARQLTPDAVSALQHNRVACVTYFSVRSVTGTIQMAKLDGLLGALSARPAICMSPAIAVAARRYHAHVAAAHAATDDAVIRAVGAIQPIE